MNPHEKALQGIFGDMDDMESKKMFNVDGGGGKPMSITITLNPNGGEPDADDFPEGHDAELCKGGCAYHSGGVVGGGDNGSGKIEQGIIDGMSVTDGKGYSKGGVIEPEEEDSEELALPKFLRKKK